MNEWRKKSQNYPLPFFSLLNLIKNDTKSKLKKKIILMSYMYADMQKETPLDFNKYVYNS